MIARLGHGGLTTDHVNARRAQRQSMIRLAHALTGSLRKHGWLGLLALALAFTGDRLRLAHPDPHRLRFAHTFTTASERQIIDDAVAEFERTHPSLRIEQTVFNSEVYQTLGWRLQFQGRCPPDLFFSWQGFKVASAIERGWALDVKPLVSAGFLDQFIPVSLEPSDGPIHFLPHSVDISNLIWYNARVFRERGLNEPATLEEWLRLCTDLRRANLLPLAQGNRDLWPMGNFGVELLAQALGGSRVHQLFQPGVLVQAQDVLGLNTIDYLRRNGGFDLPGLLQPGAIGELSDIDAKVLFLSGKSVQHVLGSWFLADIADARNKQELQFPVGVFAVPSGTGEVDAMTTVTTGFLVSRRSPNAPAAVAFLELLLSRRYQARFASLGNLSARREATEFTTDPLARRMLEILARTRVTVPPPDTGYRPEQAAVFYELCGKLLNGKLPLDQAAELWNREKQSLARKGL